MRTREELDKEFCKAVRSRYDLVPACRENQIREVVLDNRQLLTEIRDMLIGQSLAQEKEEAERCMKSG